MASTSLKGAEHGSTRFKERLRRSPRNSVQEVLSDIRLPSDHFVQPFSSSSACDESKWDELAPKRLRESPESLAREREISIAFRESTLTAARTCKCEKFLPFTLLPIELRLKIWRYALPGPMVLEIAAERLELTSEDFHTSPRLPRCENVQFNRRLCRQWVIKNAYPSSDRSNLIAACQESRQFSLEMLSGSFPTHSMDCDRKIRFDPSNDVIYIPEFQEFLNFMMHTRRVFGSEFAKIRNLAIPEALFTPPNSKINALFKICSNIKNIDVITEIWEGQGEFKILEVVVANDLLEALQTTNINLLNAQAMTTATARRSISVMIEHLNIQAYKQTLREFIEEGKTYPYPEINVKVLRNHKPNGPRLIINSDNSPCSYCAHIYATSLPRFSQLPPAVRSRIWSMTLPRPRIVRIAITVRELDTGGKGLKFDSDFENPIATMVCRESRQVALRIYNVCLWSDGLSRKIRMAYDDTPYFWNIETWLKYLKAIKNPKFIYRPCSLLANVNKFAISFQRFYEWNVETLVRLFAQFGDLESFILLENIRNVDKSRAKHKDSLIDVSSPARVCQDAYSGERRQITNKRANICRVWGDHNIERNFPDTLLMLLKDSNIQCNSCIGAKCTGRFQTPLQVPAVDDESDSEVTSL